MIPELKAAARVISQRLRKRPYQSGVSISAWDAILDQRLDGKRCGAFSWHKAISKEVKSYIAELDDETKRTIWESTEDCEIIPNADMATITECLYPFVFRAAMGPIRRAERRREAKREADNTVDTYR